MMFPTLFALISEISHKVLFFVLAFSGRKPLVSVFKFQGAMGHKMELGHCCREIICIRIKQHKVGPEGANDQKMAGPQSQTV
jgi:hypothetical protein